MQIKVLGPFEVRADDGAVADVPGARLRGLVVALALRPGQVVPKATLIDWIWGEHPPVDAANALQRLVSRLRKAVPHVVVEGLTDGCRLMIDADAVDAVRFERLVARAREDQGSQRLREALELWRGPAMQDVGLQDSEAFDAAATRLEALRLTATEDRFEAEIGLGHGADLVTELTDLVAAHPVREKLVAALMRALAAAGRISEALRVYQRTREALADELGVDPSPELSGAYADLGPGYRHITYDERARGKSKRSADYSFEGALRDLDAVLRARGVEQPLLVGWSYGGIIGWHWADRHPDRVAGLVTVDAFPVGLTGEAGRERIRKTFRGYRLLLPIAARFGLGAR
ncbi:alpha/beta fold hydrolase, partial [Lentzea sp. NPDC004782]|uniref:alpha/beta fold hydrolase n=1 Tax=Lentzea sp. NPDC004782 TaxID=3154458 RepID=UPI0033BC31D0